MPESWQYMLVAKITRSVPGFQVLLSLTTLLDVNKLHRRLTLFSGKYWSARTSDRSFWLVNQPYILECFFEVSWMVPDFAEVSVHKARHLLWFHTEVCNLKVIYKILLWTLKVQHGVEMLHLILHHGYRITETESLESRFEYSQSRSSRSVLVKS